MAESIEQMTNAPLATDYVGAQAQLRQWTFQLNKLGTIEGKTEQKQAGLLQGVINGIKAVFPGLNLETNYAIPAEAADNERAATIDEIRALANSIPIPSMGAQGSSSPIPMLNGDSTGTGLMSGLDNRTLFGLAAAAAVLVVAFFYFRS